MKVWWINLARATKRRAAVEQQLTDLGLEGARVEAVTPADLTPVQRSRYCDPRRFRWLSETELACGLSHARALSLLAGSGDAYGMVMEDDAVLSRRTPSFLAAVAAARPKVGLIKLESVPDPLYVDPRSAATLEGIALRRVFSRVNGSAAYVASAAAAAFIVSSEALRQLPTDLALFSPYDALGRRIVTWHADPSLARQHHHVVSGEDQLEPSAILGSLRMREQADVAPLPFWLEQLHRARLTFDRDVRRGIPKTIDTLLSGATKRIIPFEPE